MIRLRSSDTLVAMTTVVMAIGSLAVPVRVHAAQASTPVRQRMLGVYNADTGDAIEGAEVMDVLSRVSALTTKTGTITLAFLPDGASVLRVRRVGFAPELITVELSPADTNPITVLLHPSAQTLPTVVTKDSTPRHVAPGLQAFEQRRRLGFGTFIDEATMRKNDGRKMTDIVRTIGSLGIMCPSYGERAGQCWATSRRGGKGAFLGTGPCPVDLYIDGAVMADNDLEKLRVQTFGAIEFYAGGATIPVQYNKTGSSCGVLLLWSRDR